MRISDWSSDVCSSDLVVIHRCAEQHPIIDLWPSYALIKLVDSGFWQNGWDGAENPIAKRSKANGRGPGGKPLEPGMQGWVIVPVEPQPCKRSAPGRGRHFGNHTSTRRKPLATNQLTAEVGEAQR